MLVDFKLNLLLEEILSDLICDVWIDCMLGNGGLLDLGQEGTPLIGTVYVCFSCRCSINAYELFEEMLK